MDENVFAAIIRSDKAKPLSALNHFTKPVILLDIFYSFILGLSANRALIQKLLSVQRETQKKGIMPDNENCFSKLLVCCLSFKPTQLLTHDN